MQPVLISNATTMALSDVGSVAVPLGQPVAQLEMFRGGFVTG
jgi:hypothetical protein